MSEVLSDSPYTDEERAYLERGGDVPEPKPEVAAQPELPAAAEPPSPEPATDDDEDGVTEEVGEDGSRKRRVKFETYTRVKAERAELKKQLEEQRQHRELREREHAVFRATAEERLRMFAAAQQAAQPRPEPPPPPAAPPDVEEDPVAFIRWQNEQLQAHGDRLRQFEAAAQQTAQQQHLQAQVQQIDRDYYTDNHAAAREMPTYPSAYDFLVGKAEQIIQAQNPRFTPDQVQQERLRQERALAYSARQQGIRPAQLILQTAHIYGWRPPQPAQPEAAQPDPAAEQARIDAVARGQAQNRTLSSAGRSGPSGGMSIEKLLDMPEAEFAEWTAKNPDALARMQGAH